MDKQFVLNEGILRKMGWKEYSDLLVLLPLQDENVILVFEKEIKFDWFIIKNKQNQYKLIYINTEPGQIKGELIYGVDSVIRDINSNLELFRIIIDNELYKGRGYNRHFKINRILRK